MPNFLRMLGTGKLWDNVNSGGGSVKIPQTSLAGNATTPARTNNFVPGPNVEPYLHTAEWKDPDRLRTAPNHLQPFVPVQEPRNDLWNSVYDDPQQQRSTAQPQNLPLNLKAPGVAFAPTQVRQRENLYDAGDFRTLQRFAFAHTDSQRYFDQMEPIPEFTTPLRRVHGVYTNQAVLKRGWSQTEVPETGMSANHVGVAPAYLLSTPLRVKTRNTGGIDGHRTAITKANAPKRKRG